jgi:succinoglycan biosynthesis protein ExoA
MPGRLPSVTIVMPVLDEAAILDECLRSVADQDYAGEWTLIVADGGSTDGTRAILESWRERRPDWRVVDNPQRRQSPGVNRAVAIAQGEIVVRMDAHTLYAPDYVTRSVAALLDGEAVAVGGPMLVRGVGRFGRAVAAAMSSPLTTGPARFHRDGASGEVDTVYLGAFRRADFIEIGGLRSFPSGAGEDADLYHRWRRAGRRIVLDPRIRSEYRPRSTVGSLFRQHVRYGGAKAELLWVNAAWPSWRPLAPALLVVGLVGSGLLALVGGPAWPLAAVAGTWAVVLLAAAVRHPRLLPALLVAGAVMHLGYGLGLWWGLLRGPWRVRRALASHASTPEGGDVSAP